MIIHASCRNPPLSRARPRRHHLLPHKHDITDANDREIHPLALGAKKTVRAFDDVVEVLTWPAPAKPTRCVARCHEGIGRC